jgi:hypothetical protein
MMEGFSLPVLCHEVGELSEKRMQRKSLFNWESAIVSASLLAPSYPKF